MAKLARIPTISGVTQVRKEKELLISFKNPMRRNVRLFFRDVPKNGGVINIWAMHIINTLGQGEVPVIHFSLRTDKKLLEAFNNKYPQLVQFTFQGRGATKRMETHLRSLT